VEHEAGRLKHDSNALDSPASAVLQELFHATHSAVAPCQSNHHSCPGTWIPTVAVTKPVIRPVPSLRIHLQAQPPS
jgi:hypothetical protein